MKYNSRTILKQSLLSFAITTTFATSFIASANETEEENVEVFTVTASRSSMEMGDVLTSQVVISRADIEVMNPTSVLDILSTVPSIDVASNGGRGQSASIFMRGTNSDHVLVLVDGIRVSSATSGGASLSSISPELIERIEIVQGPRASLWGSDAIGGVIQIFTRKLASGEFFAGASFGTDSFQKYKAGIGFSHGDGQTSVSVSHEKSDGFDVKEDDEPDDDGYEFTSVAIRGQQNVTTDLTLDWLFSSDRGDNEYDGYYNGSDIKNHVWLIRANYDSNFNGIDNKTVMFIGQNRDYADSLSNGVSKGIYETRRDQYSLVNTSQMSENFQVNFGVDHYQDDVSQSTKNYEQAQRDTTGVFAHALFSDQAWTYEATIRHDNVEDIDSENTYNAGVGYQMNADSRVVLNYGTGFKAPTFNNLYYPGSGNPNLSSELSDSVELFFETSIAGINTNISFYHSNIDDLIAWDGSKSVNINEVEISGAEVTLKYSGLGGTHDFNMSYTDAEDKSTNEQLVRRAKEKFNYKFVTTVASADLYAEYKFVGSRKDRGNIDLGAYQLLNLGLNYPLFEHVNLTARVTNLLDKAYQTANTYNTQERGFYLGVSYQNF
ncbi:TonB-dependent receptor domain-containing protein [Thalassotalea piscium]